MSRSKRPKNATWEITEDDLPSERLIAAEPRLAGLEENPAFRMAVYRAKVGATGAGQAGGFAFLAFYIGLIYVGNSTSIAPRLRTLAWVGYAVMTLVNVSRTRRTAALVADPLGGGVPLVCRLELYLAAFPPEEAARAMLGTMHGRRRQRQTLWGAGVAIAILLAIGLYGLLWSGTGTSAIFVVTGLGLLGLMLGMRRDGIAIGIAQLASTLRRARASARLRTNPGSETLRRGGKVLQIIVVAVLAAIVIIGCLAALFWLASGLKFPPWFGDAMMMGLVAASLPAGWLLGRWIGRRSRTKARDNWGEILGNIKYVTEQMRETEFERARAGEPR